jgi:hypothetical protein
LQESDGVILIDFVATPDGPSKPFSNMNN